MCFSIYFRFNFRITITHCECKKILIDIFFRHIFPRCFIVSSNFIHFGISSNISYLALFQTEKFFTSKQFISRLFIIDTGTYAIQDHAGVKINITLRHFTWAATHTFASWEEGLPFTVYRHCSVSVRAQMHVPCAAGYRGGLGLITTVIHILGKVTLKVTFLVTFQVRPVIEIENGACIKALQNIEFTFPESSRKPSRDP